MDHKEAKKVREENKTSQSKVTNNNEQKYTSNTGIQMKSEIIRSRRNSAEMQKYKTHSGYQLSKGRRSRGQKP
jgi:hypothetical protein